MTTALYTLTRVSDYQVFNPLRLKWDKMSEAGKRLALITTVAAAIFAILSVPPMVTGVTLSLAAVTALLWVVSRVAIKRFGYDHPTQIVHRDSGLLESKVLEGVRKFGGYKVNPEYFNDFICNNEKIRIEGKDKSCSDIDSLPWLLSHLGGNRDHLLILTALMADAPRSCYRMFQSCFPGKSIEVIRRSPISLEKFEGDINLFISAVVKLTDAEKNTSEIQQLSFSQYNDFSSTPISFTRHITFEPYIPSGRI